MENGRQRVYNFAMDTVNPKYLLEKLDIVIDNLKCAGKLNVAFGLVIQIVRTGVVGITMRIKKLHYWRDQNLWF